MSGFLYHQKNKLFEKYGHECQLLDTDVEEIKQTFFQRIYKFVTGLILVSELHVMSHELLRSQAAITRERKRQMLYFPYTIHPFSDFRKWWKYFMIVVLFIEFIIVPIDVGYHANLNFHDLFHNWFWIVIRNILDFILIVDMLLNFITGYYDYINKEVVLSIPTISKNYLQSQFLVHALSSIPTHFDLIVNGMHKPHDMSDHERRIELQLISLLKGLRMSTFKEYLLQTFADYDITYIKQLMVFVCLTIFFFVHAVTCMMCFLVEYAKTVVTDSPNITKELTFLTTRSPHHMYITNMYYATQVILSTGIPTIVMDDEFTYILIIVMCFISRIAYVYWLSQIAEIIHTIASPANKYNQMERQLREYMRHRQLPEYMQKRLLTYYEFRFQKSYFRESEILNTLSGQLRQDIIMHSCRKLVENVEFFNNLPLALIIRIVSCLRSQVFLVNDVVIRANTTGDAMYFIASGTVTILSFSGHEICHLEDGDHFGEIALVMQDELRVASVVAVEVCELYRLDRNDFIKAIQPYPDLLDEIMRIAADRMEQTVVLDEYNRREMASRRLY